MYTNYSKTVKKIYENEREHYQNVGHLEDLAGALSLDAFRFIYYQNGSVGEKPLPYVFYKNVRDIDSEMGEQIRTYLNKTFDRNIRRSGDTESICQRYFGYNKEYVQTIIGMIERYINSNGTVVDTEDQKIISIAKQLTMKDALSKEETDLVIKELSAIEKKAFDFCDAAEENLKKGFVEDMNDHLSSTTEMLKQQNGRLKVLSGQPFDLLIHSAISPESFMDRRSEKGFSTSIIDDKNIKCYSSDSPKFAFYDRLSEEDLAWATAGDNVSFSDKEDGNFTAQNPADFVEFDHFKTLTRDEKHGHTGYSELNIDNGSLRPNAIVCFDYVTEEEYEIAEKYKLDVVLVLTENYPDMQRYPDRRTNVRKIKIDLPENDDASTKS